MVLSPARSSTLESNQGRTLFHGSSYYFNRNAALDARNWFNPAPNPLAALILHQFGASAGGPIVRNKLFIFGNYEGVRDKVGNPGTVDVPVTGTLVTRPISGRSHDQHFRRIRRMRSGRSTTVRAVHDDQPATGQASARQPGPTSTVNLDFNNLNREDNGILKLDYHLSDKNTIVGTYLIGDSVQTEEDTIVTNPLFLSQADTRAQVLGGGWIWTPNARFTNQSRVGYNRFWQKVVIADGNTNPTVFGLNTGVTDPSEFRVA